MARMNFKAFIPGSRPTSTAEHQQGIGQRGKPTLTSLGIDVDRLIEDNKQAIEKARSSHQCSHKARKQRKSSASTARKSTSSAASTRRSRRHGRKSGSGSAES